MDWSKLDAGLALALSDDDRSGTFAVFVHLDPGVPPGELPMPAQTPSGESGVTTAALSYEQIDRLSELPEVHRIRLSRRLRPSREA